MKTYINKSGEDVRFGYEHEGKPVVKDVPPDGEIMLPEGVDQLVSFPNYFVEAKDLKKEKTKDEGSNKGKKAGEK